MRRTPVLLLAALSLSACSSGGSAASPGKIVGSHTYADLTASPDPAGGGATPGAQRTPLAVSTAGPYAGAPTVSPVPSGPSAGGSSGAAGRTTTTTGQAPPAAVRPGAQQVSARAGTYTLDTTGTVTLGSPGTPQDASGTSTLTVSKPAGGVQHTKAHGDQGDTEQDVLFRSNGVYASRLTLTTKAFTKDFRPASPVLLLPQPARGSWSWSAVSTDGKTTIRATNSYVRSETLTIGGKAVPCVVVQTRLVLSGDVDVTIDLTSWEATGLHLVAKDHTKTKGTYSGFPFSSDTTSVLRSTDPS